MVKCPLSFVVIGDWLDDLLRQTQTAVKLVLPESRPFVSHVDGGEVILKLRL